MTSSKIRMMPFFGGKLPQHGQEFRRGRQHPNGAQHGFDDHRRQLVFVTFQYLPGDGRLIERHHHHLFQRALAQALGGGHGVGMGALTGFGGVDSHADTHLVVAAVVAALDFGDLALTSNGPRRPDGVQRGLGARVGEPHQIKTGYPLTQQLGQAHLVGVGGVVDDAVLHLLLDRVHHRLGRMTQDQRSHGADEIQPVHAVGIDHMTARGVVHEDGIGRPEDGVPAVAARQVVLGVLPQGLGLGS